MASLPKAPPDPVQAVPIDRPEPPAIQRVRRRRRPSGEPPPLPAHLNASGKWWLGLSALVVVAWGVVIVTNTLAFVDVADTWVLQTLEDVRTPGLTRAADVAGVLATRQALYVLWLVNLLALAALRRWRHLFVWLGAGLVVVQIGSGLTSLMARPRPYEVEIIGSWAGFSMPSLPMAALSAFLISMAYAFMPWAALTPVTGVLAFQMDGVFIGATWSRDMRNMMLLSFVVYLAALIGLGKAFGNVGLWAALHIFLIVRGLSLLSVLPARIRAAFA